MLNETHQTSKKELQNVIAHLEEQLEEIKSSEDSLKSRIKELEDHLGSAEAQGKEEVM